MGAQVSTEHRADMFWEVNIESISRFYISSQQKSLCFLKKKEFLGGRLYDSRNALFSFYLVSFDLTVDCRTESG
jgi:hypothetical protein